MVGSPIDQVDKFAKENRRAVIVTLGSVLAICIASLLCIIAVP
jgi:hypothetical protein